MKRAPTRADNLRAIASQIEAHALALLDEAQRQHRWQMAASVVEASEMAGALLHRLAVAAEELILTRDEVA